MKTNSLAVASARSLALALLVSLAALPAGAAVFDDFESYAVGSNLHGQGGWSGWAGDPAAVAVVSTSFSFSPTRAVNVTGAGDLVHTFSGVTNGQWVFTVMQYIPSTSSGTNYLILLNRYGPPFGATELNWSVQMQNNMDTGQVISDLGAGASRPMVKNQWVEIRVEVNLSSNTVAEFYNGQPLSTHVWQDGSGLNELQALDLFANDAGPVYYDNVGLSPADAPGTSLELKFNQPSSFNESNRQAVLEWNAEPGKTYLVQSADDLTPGTEWKTEEPVTATKVGPVRWMAPESIRDRKFYRLVLPHPEVFSVEPAFINSSDPAALLYIFGQCLPTNGTIVINGQNFAVTSFDPNGSWVALSLNGLPPGTPVIGNILVLDNASNIVATLPLQSPVLYGTELTMEQLQGPPDEPPASPAKKEFKGHVTLLKAFDDEEDSSSAARGHTKSGHVTLLKRGGDDGSALGKHTKTGHVTLLKRGDSGDSAARHTKTGHVTLLKRGGDTGARMAGALGEGKKEFKGHVTLLKREIPGGDPDDDDDGDGLDDSGFHTLLMPALMKAKEKANRTCCSVNAATGEVVAEETDLTIPGVGLDFDWTRTYCSRTGPNTAQGAGWDFSYNVSLTQNGDGTVTLRPGNGRADTFYPNGTNGWARDEYFVEIRDLNSDGMPDVLFADTGRWLFKPLGTPAGGKLWQIIDRNGNTMTLDYNFKGQLTTIVDDLGRTNTVAYSLAGKITSVTDFSGRTVSYEYDGNGDMVACVSPPVTGTPTGNDFPGGITNRYTYTGGNADDRLNHNLASCIDGKGQTWLQVFYQPTNNPASLDFDRVDRYLCGETSHLRTYPQTPTPSNGFAVIKVVMRDAVGNVCESFHDSRQRCVRLLEYTGRAPDLNAPTTETGNRPTGKLRADDPDFYETTLTWNPDSLRIATKHAHVEVPDLFYVYERDFNSGASPRKKGDCRVVRVVAGAGGGDLDGDGVADTTELAWHFEYDPRFGSDSSRLRESPTKQSLRESPTKASLRESPTWRLRESPTKASLRESPTRQSFRLRESPSKASLRESPTKQSLRESPTRQSLRESPSKASLGFCISATDPRGNVSTASYDTNGNVVHVESADRKNGAIIAADYNYKEHSRLAAITNAPDANGYRRVDTLEYYTNGPMAGYLEKVVVDVGGVVKAFHFSYDARGNVTQSVDPRGYDMLYTHNALDQCVRVQSPTNLTSRCNTDFIYDEAGNVQDAIEELRDEADVFVRNVITHFEFDSLDRCTTRVDQVFPGGFVTNKFFYDGNSQLTLIESPLAVSGADPHSSVAFEYDERGLLFREIGAPGSGNSPTNEYHYTANGMRDRVKNLEEVLPKLGLLRYDGFSRPISYTDPMSNVVNYVYDRNGNLTLVRCYGETNDVPGSAGNRLLSSAHYDYDSLNRLTRGRFEFFDITYLTTIGDGASTTTFTYAANGDCLSVTDDNGHTTSYAYDTAGRLASVTDPKTNVMTLSYDATDNVTGMVSTERSDLTPGTTQFSRSYVYDSQGRCVRTVDNVGNTNAVAYDSFSQARRQEDPDGRSIWWVYDDLGRCTLAIADLNGDGLQDLAVDVNHSWSYDDNSRCTSSTDDNTNTTYYAYDSLDRVISETNPDGTFCSLVWSPRSNLLRVQDPNGNVISNRYDLLDHCIASDITPGPTVATTTTFERYAYDGLSRLVAATNDASHSEFSYDSLGNCASSSHQGWQIGHTHDAVGNELSLTYPSGQVVTYTYDALDQVKTVSRSSGGLPPATLATYDYDGPGRVGRIARTNNVNTRVTWDGLAGTPNAVGDYGWRQVRGINHQIAGGGAVIDQRRATYDQKQNKTLRAQTTPFYPGGDTTTNVFEYDPMDRLSRAINTTGTGATVRLYALDGVGNRQFVSSNGVVEAYLMDAAIPPGDFQMNQYTMTPFGAQSYDENGNLVVRAGADGPTFYQYDYADRLVEVAALNGGGMIGPVASFTYDALGRRISKTTYPPLPLAPVTTQFVYDGGDGDCDDGEILEEYVGGILSATYVYDDATGGNARYTGDSHICTAARHLIGGIHGGQTHFLSR